MKKMVQKVVAVVTLLTVMFVSATPAQAATKTPTISDIYKGTVRLVCVSERMDSTDYSFGYLIPSGKVTNIKSSNKKVASAFIDDEGSYGTYFVIGINKPGTAKISYTHQGKRHTVTVKVVKWKNPVKSLKVGGKEYKKFFAKTYGAYVGSSSKVSGKKVKVVPAKGWKVKQIVCEGQRVRKGHQERCEGSQEDHFPLCRSCQQEDR